MLSRRTIGWMCAAALLISLVIHPQHDYPAVAEASAVPLPVSLATLVNNDGLAASSGIGDFDGAGHAYPATSLPSSGTHTLGGIPYLLDTGSDLDNVVALGQTLPLPPGRYTSAYVLTAATYGPTTGEVTVHYADGTSTGVALYSPDWYRGPETPLLQTTYRFARSGRQWRAANLYMEQIPFDPAREAVSLTVPSTHAPAAHVASLHLFAVTLQPAVVGEGIAVSGAVTTAKTLPDGAQVIQATVTNPGSTWFTASNPVTVTVRGDGIATVDPATVSALGPGEQAGVEIGVTFPNSPSGSVRSGTVLAVTAAGASAMQTIAIPTGISPYTATTASIQQHQAPDWYNNAKFGIFVHYGLYSIPAWAPAGDTYEEWYWHSMNQKGSATYRHQLQTYGLTSTYDDFIPRFTAAHFDPKAWVTLFAAAGARYFVLVSKHHDGFALFRTRYSHRNSVDLGPRKDIVGLLLAAARTYTPQLHAGLYYSLPEWYNPAYPGIKHHRTHFPGGPPHQFVSGKPVPYTGYIPIKNYVQDFQVPQMEELIDAYHPDLLWCDIGGPNDSLRVIAHFYNSALSGPHPRQVAVNNRCGVGVHDFTTPEYRSYPLTVRAKWEASRGLDPHSYGYNQNTPDDAYASVDGLVAALVDVVSKNGNFLLDIGPRGDGTIPEVMQERLRGVGSWLATNGEAIYDTTYWWRTPEDGALRFTIRPNRAFYIISLTRPGNQVVVHEPVPIAPGDPITLLGWKGGALHWTEQNGSLTINVPPAAQQTGADAWTFRIGWNGGAG